MAWVKTTRITLIAGLLVAVGALAWLAAHPSLYAGQLGQLVTRNLLQDLGASVSFEDIRGNPLDELVFHDVSFVRTGDGSDAQYVNADSVTVRYDVRTLLRREPVLRELTVSGARVLVRVDDTGRVPDDPEAPHAWTTITELPRVEIGRLRLQGVDVEVVGADGAVIQEARGIVAELGVDSDGEALEAMVYGIAGQWTTQDLRVREAAGQVRFDPPWLECSPFHVALDTTQATVDLRLGFEADGQAMVEVAGEAEDFVLDELMRLIVADETDDLPRLRLAGRARVTYGDERLRIEGAGRGWLEGVPVSAREFVGTLDPSRFVFERIDGSYWSAEGTAEGVLYTDVEPPRLELTGDVTGVDLSDRWAGEDLGWPESSLRARAQVILELDDEDFGLRIDAEGLGGTIATLPVDDGRVTLSYDQRTGLEIDDAVVFSQDARLQARGRVGADEVVDLIVEAEATSIGAWAREIELPITGRGLVGGGRLIGPLDALALDADGTIDSLSWGQAQAVEGRFWVRIPRVDVPERLRAGLAAPRLELAGNDAGEFEAELDSEDAVHRIPFLTLSAPDSSLRLSGRVIEQPATGDFRVEIDSLLADLGGERWTLAAPGAMVVGATGFATSGIELTSATGSFRLEGRADEQGELDLALEVSDGDLSILDRIGVVDAIGGHVEGSLSLAGTAAYPVVDLDFRIENFALQDRVVDRATIRGTSAGRDVTLEDLQLDTDAGNARASGTLVLPFDDWLARLREDPAQVRDLWSRARLDIAAGSQGLDLERWLDPNTAGGGFGLVDAGVRVTGRTRVPRIEGRVTVVDFPAEPFELPSMGGLIVADSTGVRLREGHVDLGGPDARVSATLPLFVSLVGPSRFASDAPLIADLDTGDDLDLSSLTTLWPQVRSIGGRGRLVMNARGSFDDPDLSGTLIVRDGSFALEGWAEDVREVSIDGRFADEVLEITRLEGREGLNGRIQGSGRVLFVDYLPDDITLDLRAQRVLIASVPFLRAIASSDDLRLTIERPSSGAPRAPKITGTVRVDKAIYTGEFVQAGAEPDPALLPTAAPDWLADLRIRAQDQVRISNQSAELRVSGDVTLVRDTDGLRLRGDAQIPQGQVPLFNNDFTITEGSLDFSRRPVEPEVDIRAETEVPIYDPSGNFGRELERITVHLTGTFAEPQVRFESESGLDETAILRLLAGFGSTSPEATPTGLGDVGVRAGLNFLERALANRIRGVDTIDIETEEAGLADMQSTRIAVGKYLSSSLYLRYSQGLSVTERDLFLEYQMTRRLLFTSELRRRLRESGAENEFNLDLKFRVKY